MTDTISPLSPDRRAPLDIGAILTDMRVSGRLELVHYAGAAHRDRTAWWVCFHYVADKTAAEGMLKTRALISARNS